MTRWLWLVAAGLVACGDPSSNCEIVVNGATICLDGAGSRSFCERNMGGVATPSDSTDDPTCATLGYGVECAGPLTQVGSDYTATYNTFRAEAEEDCAAAQGATFTTTDAL